MGLFIHPVTLHPKCTLMVRWLLGYQGVTDFRNPSDATAGLPMEGETILGCERRGRFKVLQKISLRFTSFVFLIPVSLPSTSKDFCLYPQPSYTQCHRPARRHCRRGWWSSGISMPWNCTGMPCPMVAGPKQP